MPKFQSTHPRGVRRLYVEERGPGTYFNPRTHVGCDPALTALMTLSAEFQSTHPRGVRRTLRRTTVTPTRYFNPRTHVGCDATGIYKDIFTVYISIHAPTWGATKQLHRVFQNTLFQSTHPRGVRPARSAPFSITQNFNPRTHVGCDLETIIRPERAPISIHAPTWGAT